MNGHVLVVEHLDRLSRQGHEEVLPLLTRLTQNGVTVATVDGNTTYKAFERVPLEQVMLALLKSELGREESFKKATRLAAAWQKKVEKAQATSGSHIAITSTVPAWLNVDPVTKKMSLNEDRVRVLREIFQLTIDGYGTPAIAKLLNARGEPVWKHRNVKSKHGWTVGYLTKIVLNRAVLGEYDPKRQPRNSGRGTSRGITILDYYPQAIDPVTFAKAGVARESRTGTSGSWQITHGNLLSGIAKCSCCGGRMFQQVSVRKGQMRPDGKRSGRKYAAKTDISYLTCHNAWNRTMDEETGALKCEQRVKLRYEPLEQSIVEVFSIYYAGAMTGSDPAQVRKLEAELAEARRQKEGRQTQADNLARSFAESGSAMMERLALEAENEVADWTKKVATLEKQLSSERSNLAVDDDADQRELRRSIEQLRHDIFSDDDDARKNARVRMKQFFGRLNLHVTCYATKDVTMGMGDTGFRWKFGPDGSSLGVEEVALQAAE